MNIYVINGPNINLLGTREPEIYGKETLEGISKECQEEASKVGHSVKFMQSNYEGEIVEWIQDAIIESRCNCNQCRCLYSHINCDS